MTKRRPPTLRTLKSRLVSARKLEAVLVDKLARIRTEAERLDKRIAKMEDNK